MWPSSRRALAATFVGVTIPKDTKNWTWVLDRRCAECAFDATTVRRDQVSFLLRDNAAAWRPLLDAPLVARRPSPQVWSALEYACHVRDVFRIYDGRLSRMLDESDPLYPNWDQDETAVSDQYEQQRVELVANELETAA